MPATSTGCPLSSLATIALASLRTTSVLRRHSHLTCGCEAGWMCARAACFALRTSRIRPSPSRPRRLAPVTAGAAQRKMGLACRRECAKACTRDAQTRQPRISHERPCILNYCESLPQWVELHRSQAAAHTNQAQDEHRVDAQADRGGCRQGHMRRLEAYNLGRCLHYSLQSGACCRPRSRGWLCIDTV